MFSQPKLSARMDVFASAMQRSQPRLSFLDKTKNASSDSCFSAVIHDYLIDNALINHSRTLKSREKILSRQSSTIRMDSDMGALTSGIKIKVILKSLYLTQITSDHLSFVQFIPFTPVFCSADLHIWTQSDPVSPTLAWTRQCQC